MFDSMRFYVNNRESICGFQKDFEPCYTFNKAEKLGNWLLTPLHKVITEFDNTNSKFKKTALLIVGLFASIIGGFGALIKRLGECFNSNSVIRRKTLDILKEAERQLDLNLIYNPKGFNYSLKKEFIEKFLVGQGFDYKGTYLPHEVQNLKLDMFEIYKRILSSQPDKEKVAIITAGGPGVGKTTKLRQHLEANRLANKKFAYICPDDVCLKNMTNTFTAELNHSEALLDARRKPYENSLPKANYNATNLPFSINDINPVVAQKAVESYKANLALKNESLETRKKLYDKWRPGSNAANHIILANIIREGFAFYFGTTASSPPTKLFFEFLKNQGYKIKLIHVSSPADVCWDSIIERDKTFVQTTELDVIEKAKLVPQRINDTYLAFADEIEFYYRSAVNENAVFAANWVANKDKTSDKIGTLRVINYSCYQKIKAIHNYTAALLKKPDLDWNTSVEKRSIV